MSLAIFNIPSKRHRHSNSRKKHKSSSDSSSTTSSTSSSSAPPKECPLRFILTALISSSPSEVEEMPRDGCPLKRIKLLHTIPLCVFVMCNMWLVIGALLGIAIWRLSEMGWRGIGSLLDEYSGQVIKEKEKEKEVKEVRFAYNLREGYHLEK